MQHHLIRILRIIERVPLTPIVADGVREDGPVPVERGGGDGSANRRIALETGVGVLVPEVEGPVRACSAEGTVDRVEGDGIDGVDLDLVVGGRFPMTSEGEVGTKESMLILGRLDLSP